MSLNGLNLHVLLSVHFLIKILEIILDIVCVALVSGDLIIAKSVAKIEVVYATYFGFLIVGAIVVAGFVVDTPIHGKLVMLISGCAAVMFIAAGSLNLELYDVWGPKNEKLLAAGVVALLNAAVYLVDMYLTWRKI